MEPTRWKRPRGSRIYCSESSESANLIAPVNITRLLILRSTPSSKSVSHAVSSIVSVPWVTVTDVWPSSMAEQTAPAMSTMSKIVRSHEGFVPTSMIESKSTPAELASSCPVSIRCCRSDQHIVPPVAIRAEGIFTILDVDLTNICDQKSHVSSHKPNRRHRTNPTPTDKSCRGTRLKPTPPDQSDRMLSPHNPSVVGSIPTGPTKRFIPK